MAKITHDEIKSFRNLGLVNERAFRDLADLSKELRLKRGYLGFSSERIKNFTIHGHECSPDVKFAILNYFENRVLEMKKIIENV